MEKKRQSMDEWIDGWMDRKKLDGIIWPKGIFCKTPRSVHIQGAKHTLPDLLFWLKEPNITARCRLLESTGNKNTMFLLMA